MAIKKSELYNSLWKSCDELRGGMDASQYKDYVLTLLFVKYISDKYKGKKFSAIKVPEGASFDDMVALVGTSNIGDDINKKILYRIKEANGLNDFPDFNDEGKLGKGKDLIDTVGNLILIFNSPDLDFSGNKANDDDLLGDAYEFLMQHFAVDSGKSKGQFYTPSEVSRIIAKVVGINEKNSTRQTTAYDPTCGSGSLLLKVANEAQKDIDLYGQERDIATANLSRMNMILHGVPSAQIVADNTLSNPAFIIKNESQQKNELLVAEPTNRYGNKTLQTFDYIVANPPFSLKNWSNGISINNDEYGRFELGIPPDKNGDYAFLLHIIKSMRSNGKAAVVLPHGVLFRGNSEGEIRKNIIKKGYIKGIIGLPPNLFYGTGIPACIIILDKEQASQRKDIFMLDASKDFVKDGNKNRLQEKDIRKITEIFNNFIEIPKYSRIISLDEIANDKNDYNLNIPRYIDSQEEGDIQDIDAHLFGGIPERDVKSLEKYWDIFPDLKNSLFERQRVGYYNLKVSNDEVKNTIFNHHQFLSYRNQLQKTFDDWIKDKKNYFEQLDKGINPKKEIVDLGDSILKTFKKDALIDPYSMYQYLMLYWEEVMQDDFYTIAIDSWEAGIEWEREIIKGKKGKDGKVAKDKAIDGLEGIIGRMITPDLLIQEFFAKEWEAVIDFEKQIENAKAELEEIKEETEVENGIFSDLEKVNLTSVKGLLKQRKSEKAPKEEIDVIENYINLNEAILSFTKLIKIQKETIEKLVVEMYPKLSESEIKDLVINKKWIKHLESCLHEEKERMSQTLTGRIMELVERYKVTLPEAETTLKEYETKVKSHLQKMGWQW